MYHINYFINKFKAEISFVLFLMTSSLAKAQEQAAANVDSATSSGIVLDVNTALVLTAVILIIPIYFLSKTFSVSAKIYLDKKSKGALMVLAIFLSSLNHVFGQESASNAAATMGSASSISSNLTTYAIGFVIFMELLAIAYLGYQTLWFLRNANKTQADASGIANEKASRNSFQLWWDKINSFRPIEEEGVLDTGHNYDGIRELNNITPPWFTAAFLASILFAIVYLWRYHVVGSAPLQIEEYNIEMAAAEEQKVKFLAKQANNVDETNVKMLGVEDIQAGKALFASKCAVCHGEHGGSSPTGVGPNLADDYWIHGGSISDIFKTIKYGWPEKGMISWKDQFTPNQMAQLSSFIKSIKGSNPAGAREPQGDLYTEESATTPTSTTDSPQTKPDTISVSK